MNPRLNLLAGIFILLSVTAITLGTSICKTMDLELSAEYIIDNAGFFDGKVVRVFGEVRGGSIFSGGGRIGIEGLDVEGEYHVSGTYHASENKITVTGAGQNMDSRLAFTFLGGLLVLYVFVREIRA